MVFDDEMLCYVDASLLRHDVFDAVYRPYRVEMRRFNAYPNILLVPCYADNSIPRTPQIAT